MNYIKALNVLGKLVKSGQIKSVEEAIGTLQQMGAKVDGLLRQGVENLFKTTKARNPEAFKGWTPSVIEGGKEKAAILADRKKTMEKFMPRIKSIVTEVMRSKTVNQLEGEFLKDAKEQMKKRLNEEIFVKIFKKETGDCFGCNGYTITVEDVNISRLVIQ